MFYAKVIYYYKAQNTEKIDTKHLYICMIFREIFQENLIFIEKSAQLKVGALLKSGQTLLTMSKHYNLLRLGFSFRVRSFCYWQKRVQRNTCFNYLRPFQMKRLEVNAYQLPTRVSVF